MNTALLLLMKQSGGLITDADVGLCHTLVRACVLVRRLVGLVSDVSRALAEQTGGQRFYSQRSINLAR